MNLAGAVQANGNRLDWPETQMRAFLTQSQEAGSDASPLLGVSLAAGVRQRWDGDGRPPASSDLSAYKLVRHGDIVMNALGKPHGSIGASLIEGITSPAYWVMRVGNKADSRFVHYLLRSSHLVAEYQRLGKNQPPNQFDISWMDFRRISVPLPDVSMQRSIADYLDRETARIDTLIEEQQRLIVMLRERREATVRFVLLSGLESADVAPSGVEALGSIPSHWRMIPTRYLCNVVTGSEDSGNATDDGEYPFYVRGREVLRIDHYTFDGEAVMTPGDGQGGTGKVFHYFEGKFEAHQRVYVFKDFKDVSGRYFYYFLSTFLRPVALAGSNTVTMESLRRPLLVDFKIAVPPLDEQARITAFLDEQLAKVDALIAETKRFIELAGERRSALITNAVTGRSTCGRWRDGRPQRGRLRDRDLRAPCPTRVAVLGERRRL